MQTVLGTHKRKFVFSVMGTLPENMAEDFAKEFIKRAGMNPARRGRIDRYPYRGGGGVGWTGYFPLMQSWMMIDVYDEINETEITLSTCCPDRVNLDVLENYIKCQLGPLKEGVQTT